MMVTERPRYVSVAVALPISKRYHYVVPDELIDVLEVGHGVIVPFGPRRITAFVIERTDEVSVDVASLKPIERLLTPKPLFDQKTLEFLKWVSGYYHHPLGEVIRTTLPPGLLVQSRLLCTLTPKGEAVLAASREPDMPEIQLLAYLRDRGALPWRRIIEQRPVSGITRLLQKAADAGWVDLAQSLEAPRTRSRTVKVYRSGMPVSPRDVRGPVQQAVVELLAEMGEAEFEALEVVMKERGHGASSLRAALRRMVSRGLIEQAQRERWRDTAGGFELEDTKVELTEAQRSVVRDITVALDAGEYSAKLLFGVTGSGKTEVYLRAVLETLERHLGVIVLVPEIGLTPQLVGRFRARFGDQVACLHSGMGQGERFDAWRKLEQGIARVAIGARSTVFAPVRSLGLIVVDEEHDSSFKQESGLRYNARDLAVVRAKMSAAVVVLGSATPALESMANARRHRFQSLNLSARVLDRPLPEVAIVDMTRPENRPREEASALSPVLEGALEETLSSGHQVILLLNRRGFAPFVLCEKCGGAFRCLHCDISLTYHRRRNRLLCHYCGLSLALPGHCPHCGEKGLSLMGQGTERLEQTLAEKLPGVVVARLDRDTTGVRDAHLRILDAFRKGETRVLIGTQMVVKGHDFPGVTLVGILQADHSLQLPDFRAAERTFQLVTQVAGRAGRGETPGQVFVQTYAPNHPCIQLAAHHHYEGFYLREMRIRHAYGYPPYVRLAMFHISAVDEAAAEVHARKLAHILRKHARALEGRGLEVLGPCPAPLSRLQKWFRWQILIKSVRASSIQDLVRAAREEVEFNPRRVQLRVAVDIDPQSLL